MVRAERYRPVFSWEKARMLFWDRWEKARSLYWASPRWMNRVLARYRANWERKITADNPKQNRVVWASWARFPVVMMSKMYPSR